jgi:hypothetical protein
MLKQKYNWYLTDKLIVAIILIAAGGGLWEGHSSSQGIDFTGYATLLLALCTVWMAFKTAVTATETSRLAEETTRLATVAQATMDAETRREKGTRTPFLLFDFNDQHEDGTVAPGFRLKDDDGSLSLSGFMRNIGLYKAKRCSDKPGHLNPTCQ